MEFWYEPLLKTTIGKRTFLLPLADKLFTAIQLFLFTFKRHFNCEHPAPRRTKIETNKQKNIAINLLRAIGGKSLLRVRVRE